MGKVTYRGSKPQEEREKKVWTPYEIVTGQNLKPFFYTQSTEPRQDWTPPAHLRTGRSSKSEPSLKDTKEENQEGSS